MRFQTLTTFLLAPLHALAFVDFTNVAFTGITIGQAFNLSWQGDGTPVTITLMNGPTTSLAKVSVVAASATGTSYAWTPASTLATGTYVLSIAQSGSTNYSPQFSIAATTGSTPVTESKQNIVGPSTTYPSHPATGTWAAFTALAAVVSQPPFLVSSGSASYPPSETVGTLPRSDLGDGSVYSGRGGRMGVAGLVVGGVVGVVGWVVMV